MPTRINGMFIIIIILISNQTPSDVFTIRHWSKFEEDRRRNNVEDDHSTTATHIALFSSKDIILI